MPAMSREECMVLRANIYDLSEKGAKQALLGMVEILLEHPSILSNVFRLLVEDASLMTRWNAEAVASEKSKSAVGGG